MNLVAALAPFHPHRLALRGDCYRGTLTVGVLDTQFGTSHEAHGPLGELSIPRLHDLSRTHNLGLERLATMLGASAPSTYEQRLLAAAGWAGRATLAARPEECFLLLAVALETAALGGAAHQDVAYQVRLRVAQILRGAGRDPRDVSRHVKDLYAIRSKIVHSGHFQVPDADVWLLKELCHATIRRLLADPPFQEFHTEEDLREWFESSLWRPEPRDD